MKSTLGKLLMAAGLLLVAFGLCFFTACSQQAYPDLNWVAALAIAATGVVLGTLADDLDPPKDDPHA